MGFLKNLFKPGGDTIKGTIEGIGTLAKDLRQAITGDLPAPERAALLGKTLDIMQGVLKTQSSTIIAEAQSKSWLTRSWRPITMLTFVVLIVLEATAALPVKLPSDIWVVIKLGLGGYVVGRSVEKIADKISTTYIGRNK